MIFRQLFEPISSTYTYLLGCATTGQALLIDRVVNSVDRGSLELQPLHTPGHTDGHFAYVLGDRVFTGDAHDGKRARLTTPGLAVAAPVARLLKDARP